MTIRFIYDISKQKHSGYAFTEKHAFAVHSSLTTCGWLLHADCPPRADVPTTCALPACVTCPLHEVYLHAVVTSDNLKEVSSSTQQDSEASSH